MVSERLKRMVTFRKFNLLDSFGWLDDLDLVLCRNVLMHFDRAARLSVLERLAETLSPDGVLLLGETETVQGIPSLSGASRRHRDSMPRPRRRSRASAPRSRRAAGPFSFSSTLIGAGSGSPISATSKWKVCSSANSPFSAACSTWSV